MFKIVGNRGFSFRLQGEISLASVNHRVAHRFLAVCLGIFPLVAAEKITTGPPVLVAESGAREGPSWDPFNGVLYFVSGNNIDRLTKDGKVEPFRTDAPGANGSLIDLQGRVLACEAGGRRVTRTEKDGTLTILADNYEGRKLNFLRMISPSIRRDASTSQIRAMAAWTPWRSRMKPANWLRVCTASTPPVRLRES